MKQIFIFSFFLLWSPSLISQVITIEHFEDTTIDKLVLDNGSLVPITSEIIENGFKFQVLNSSGINVIQTENSVYNFNDVTSFENTSISRIFTLKNLVFEDGGKKVIIKLKKGAIERTVTLIVKPDSEDFNGLGYRSVLNVPKDSCVVLRGFDEKFGEELKYFNSRKVVYVYDFNKNPSKREFYKIYKKRGTLKIEVVNFNKEKLLPGTNVKFKIFNVNKFMYNVSIADSVINFESEPSALFTRLFLGDSTLLGSLMGSYSEKIKPTSTGLANLNELIGAFVQKYNWLQNKVLSAYDPCTAFPCCYSIQYLELANDLSLIRAKSVVLQEEISEKRTIVDENNKELESCTKNDKAIKVNKAAIEKCEGDIKEIKEILPSLSGDAKKKKEEELVAKQTDLRKLQDEKAKLDDVNASKCSVEKRKEYESKIESVKKELSEISSITKILDNLPSDKELKKIIVFLKNMVETNNSHTIDYVSLNGNMLDLKISITSKDSIFNYFSIPEYKNDPIQIQIPIILKPFVSFSTGSFMAFGKHLLNKTYTWQETIGSNNSIDSSKYTLVESGYTLPPMGFSALGNVEWKLSRFMGFGFSAGVGLTIEKSPRLTYLGGGSIFVGDFRQFALSCGFLGMQVDRLTNNFLDVSNNQIVYSSKAKIDYFSEFKVGGFISLTYTPFKLTKSKSVKSLNK